MANRLVVRGCSKGFSRRSPRARCGARAVLVATRTKLTNNVRGWMWRQLWKLRSGTTRTFAERVRGQLSPSVVPYPSTAPASNPGPHGPPETLIVGAHHGTPGPPWLPARLCARTARAASSEAPRRVHLDPCTGTAGRDADHRRDLGGRSPLSATGLRAEPLGAAFDPARRGGRLAARRSGGRAGLARSSWRSTATSSRSCRSSGCSPRAAATSRRLRRWRPARPGARGARRRFAEAPRRCRSSDWPRWPAATSRARRGAAG